MDQLADDTVVAVCRGQERQAVTKKVTEHWIRCCAPPTCVEKRTSTVTKVAGKVVLPQCITGEGRTSVLSNEAAHDPAGNPSRRSNEDG